MKTIKRIFATLAVAAILVAPACKKENSPTGHMAMQMTEAREAGDPPSNPAIVSVFIDIKAVEVHFEDETKGSGGWVALNTRAGIYDLIALQNNVTAVLADDTKLPVGHITQLRFVLGPNNSVCITGSGQLPLEVPSGESSGLKINVHTTIMESAHWMVTLAFDADKSIVLEGSGQYKLKPVIEVKSIVKYQ